ncbi:MAG: hypothetical protein IPH31_13950 [Lewinellaceae bacterium]|nr:hypothetical protein [Lewinellaceae bacterium]
MMVFLMGVDWWIGGLVIGGLVIDLPAEALAKEGKFLIGVDPPTPRLRRVNKKSETLRKAVGFAFNYSIKTS